MLFHQPHNSVGNYSYNAMIYTDVKWDSHFHKNFELIYVLSGKVRCIAGEHHAELAAGDFAMCLSNEVHSLCSIGSSQCWVGVFSGDFVHAFEKQTHGKQGSGLVFRCEKTVEEYLKANLITADTPSVYRLKSCLYAACDEYCKQIALKKCESRNSLLMRSITDYLSENYQNEISLSTMAERLGYNYHYLSKCFHRIFGMSFTRFLNSYRLDAALEMLTETDLSITDIALQSGFQSVRNFNDCFKLSIGTTPTRYRQRAAAAEATNRMKME